MCFLNFMSLFLALMVEQSKNPPYIPVRSNMKPTKDDVLNGMIRQITSGGPFDPNHFRAIRDFYFRLPPNEFEQYCKKPYTQLMTSLSSYVQNVHTDETKLQENIKYISNLLSLLTFLNYKFNDFTSMDHINLIATQVKECNLKHLCYYLKIIRNSFENHEKDFEKNSKLASEMIFLAISHRIDSFLARFESLEPHEYFPLITTITILLTCVKSVELMKTIFLRLQGKFEKILNYQIPDDVPYTKRATIQLLKVKCGILMGNTSLNATNNPAITNLIVKTYMDILTQTSGVASTLVDETLNSFSYFLKQDNAKRIDIAAKCFPTLLQYKYYNSENFITYHNLIRNILEIVFKRDARFEIKVPREMFSINFCKFDAGILHFSMLQYSASNFRFGENMQFIRFPQDDPKTTAGIFTLFFNSIDTGFVEMAANLANIKPVVSNPKVLSQILMQLHNFADCYYRLLKYFQTFLSKLFPQDENEKRQLYKQLYVVVSLIEIEILYSCFRHALIFTMKFRSILHHGSELIYIPMPVGDTESGLKQCTAILESARKFGRIRVYHINSVKELVKCLVMTTPMMMDNVWDFFFHDFFALDEEIYFDNFLFKDILRESTLLESFVNSLIKYSLRELRKGYNVKHLIRSLTHLFEKATQKPNPQLQNVHRPQEPQYQPNTSQEFKNAISIPSNRLLEVCKDYAKSYVFCSDILSLICNYHAFMEFIMGSASNPLKFNEALVNDICSSADTYGATPKALCHFIGFAANIQKEFLKGRYVIGALINALKIELRSPLALLKSCYDRFESQFLTHPLMPQFYSTLLAYLDTTTDELRPVIVNFLRNIPKNIIEEIIFPPSNYPTAKTLVLETKSKIIRADFDSFLHGVNCAMSDHPQIDSLWEVSKNLIITVFSSDNWTSDIRKYFQSILMFMLPLRQKNTAACDSVFKSLITQFSENTAAMAHIFCGLCSYFSHPPSHILSQIFQSVSSKQKMSVFINEIAYISSLQIFPTKGVSETICTIIMEEVQPELIDPIVFAMFVHRTINELNGSDWKDQQKCDSYTKFIELDFVPRSLQKIIVFARNLLGEHSGSIMPILHSMRISSAFFSILVQSELISLCPYTSEVHDFIAECFEDEMMEHDYGLFRFLGPLFRAFPSALPDFKQKTLQLLLSRLPMIANAPAKVQGTYLVLLVPILDSSLFDCAQFEDAINVILKFLDHQNTFLKCQAQLAAQIFAKKGPEHIREKFKEIVQNKLTSFYNLDKSQNKLTSINWRDLNDALFSYYLIVPDVFIQTMMKQLELIPSAIQDAASQSLNSRDMISSLKALCSFMATGSVVNHLVQANTFLEVARSFVNMFNSISLLPRQDFVDIMIDYFSFAPQLFPEFFKQSMSDAKALQFLDVVSQNDRSKPLFQSVEEPLLPIIKEALKVKDNMTYLQALLSYVVCSLNAAKYDSELIELLEQIFHEVLNSFDTNFENFSTVIYQKLLEFFGLNHPKVLLQLAFHVLEIRNPLLVTQYAQYYSKLLSSEVLSPELFYSIEYSKEMRLNSLFFNIFLIPYVQAHNDQVEVIMNFAREKFNLYVYITFINTLFEKNVSFDQEKLKPLDLFNECEDDATRLQVLLLWAYSKQSENFVKMFENFLGYIHNYLPIEIKQICSLMRVPPELPEEDMKNVLMKIGEIIKDYSRYPHVLLPVFKLIINNGKNFKRHPLQLFHYSIQEHTLWIEFFQKKANNSSAFNIFIELTNLIDGSCPEEEQPLANHLASFAIKQIASNKEQPQVLHKIGPNIFPSVMKLVKYVSQSVSQSYINDIMMFIVETHAKVAASSNQQPSQYEQILSQLVKLIPDAIQIIAAGPFFAHVDKILDILVYITFNDTYMWSHSLNSLYYIIESPMYGQKALDRLAGAENDELIARLFPILWRHPPNPTYRQTFLLPFAVKSCRNFSTDVPVYTFQSNSIMLYVLEHPYDNSTSFMLNAAIENLSKLNQQEACFYIGRFIVQSFSMEKLTPTMQSVLINFLSAPKIAATFFQMCPPSLKEKVLPILPLGVKFYSMFRIYPKLDAKVMDLINTLPRKELIERCVNSELWHIPFSHIVSPFFKDMKICDMLKIAQHINPEALGQMCKGINFDLETENPQIRFEVGPGNMQSSINMATWEEAVKYIGGDFEYAREEVAQRPLLRFRQGYEVNEKEMIGYVPEISYEMCKRILQPPDLLSERALDFINEHRSVQNFQRDIQFFTQTNCDRVCRNNLKDFLVANELCNIQNFFKLTDKNQRTNTVFFTLVLSQNDPPILHKVYEQIRKQTLDALGSMTEINVHPEEIHKVTFNEALRLNSPEIPSYRTDDLISARPNDVEALLCQLLAVSKDIDVNDAVAGIIKGALRTIPTSDILFAFLATIIDKLEPYVPLIIDSAIQIPVRWASLFAKKISSNNKLSSLTKLLPKSAGITTHLSGCEVGVEIKKKLVSFISPVKAMLDTPIAQLIKKVNGVEAKLYKAIVTDTITESLINEADETVTDMENQIKGFDGLLSLGEFCLDSTQAPFVDEVTGNATQLAGYIKNAESRLISLDVLTTTGTRVSYIVYPSNSVDVGFSTFMSCLSTILMRSPASFSRNISLPSLLSVDIAEGFVLSKTNADFYVPMFAIRSLYDAAKNKKVPEDLQTIKPGPHEYVKKRSYCEYFSTLTGRYAAFSAIQIFFGGDVSPLSLFFDTQSPYIWGEKPNTELPASLRLRGRFSTLLDEALVKGVFRSAFIATADAIVSNASNITVLMNSTMENGSDFINKFVSEARFFSTRSDDTDETQKKINKLIADATVCEDIRFTPWL